VTDNLFNKNDGNHQGANDPLFGEAPKHNQQNEEAPSSFFEHYVGDGKKYSDPESLARSRWEADQFIKRLQEENAGMREDLKNRVTIESLVDKIEASTKNKNSSDNTNKEYQSELESYRHEGNNSNEALSKEDLETLIENRLRQEEQKREQARNRNHIASVLQQNWGPSWQYDLTKKANELGVSQDFLVNLADKQPEAFLNIVGGKEKKVSNSNEGFIPSQAKNSQAMGATNSSGIKYSWDYFDKMRKERPHEYWSPSTRRLLFDLTAKGVLPPR